MISIFNGSTRGLSNPTEATTYVQVHHSIMPWIKRFTASEWMVFTTLSLHMDVNGYCFPSLSGIASATGLSEATVRRCLHSLQNIEIDGRRVLSVNIRHHDSGRQTSNGYILFPDAGEGVKNVRGEGVKNDTGEGVKNDTPINYNQKEPESKGTNILRGKRSTPKLPALDDPGRLLYEAYRSITYPELAPSEFNLAEWAGARHIVYQMHHKGISASQVEQAVRTLVLKWGGRRDLVTIAALWKHWSVATTGMAVPYKDPKRKETTTAEVSEAAVDVFRKVTGGDW